MNSLPRGILHPADAQNKYSLVRFPPSAKLAPFVQHYWVIDWDLRGSSPHTQAVLSHPNVNLVFEAHQSRVYGVSEGTRSQLIEGAGRVIGVKFKPGGFYPFWKKPISQLTGTSLSVDEVFGADSSLIEQQLLLLQTGEEAASLADQFLLRFLPEPDSGSELASDIVYRIRDNRSIIKAEEAARQADMHIRSLQRLFDRYVGVSPKWVILRYRLHEAAERIVQEAPPDWSTLSLELGYYDQSHFIHDFKAFVGSSPEEYLRMNQISLPQMQP